MNKSTTTIAAKKDTSTLVRAVFSPGMLLQHDDLEQLNVYPRELSRLLFRSFFGCGVVCGLEVSVDVNCGNVYVTVESGVALDCSGDPLYVPKDEKFAIDEDCNPHLPGKLWVLLCGSQKCCAPRTSMCTCDDDGATSQCTRQRDCFEIRVVSKLPECACYYGDERIYVDTKCNCASPDDPYYRDHYKGKCGCQCDGESSCDCSCVVLAKLILDDEKWVTDYSVRRFIRPVLIRDPLVKLPDQQVEPKAEKKKHKP